MQHVVIYIMIENKADTGNEFKHSNVIREIKLINTTNLPVFTTCNVCNIHVNRVQYQ